MQTHSIRKIRYLYYQREANYFGLDNLSRKSWSGTIGTLDLQLQYYAKSNVMLVVNVFLRNSLP
jgi:hypothetical protein